MSEFWTGLLASPLFWITATLATFALGEWLHRKAKHSPLVNPVLISIVLIGVMLPLTGTDYDTYFDGAQFIHFLLGPATVALALPLYLHRDLIRRALIPMAVALTVGSTFSAVSGLLIAKWMGVDLVSTLSLVPKSATSPVAMPVAEIIGGSATLTAVFVILVGIVGAMLGPPLLSALGMTDPQSRGFSLGTIAGGIGTAKALQENEAAGAFASIGMGLGALLTALITPVVVALLL
ncbi:LrgB family protein [Paracoccaceae bacterium GXU_MW_L88]